MTKCNKIINVSAVKFELSCAKNKQAGVVSLLFAVIERLHIWGILTVRCKPSCIHHA